MKTKPVFIYFLLLMAMIFWSFSYIWTKNVLQYLNPISIIFIRLIIASVFLIGLSLLVKKLQPIQRKDIPKFLLLALFEPFIYFLGETYGLKFVSPSVVAIIISTIPLFIPLSMFVLAKETIKPATYLGIFIAFIGILMVILKPDLSFAASPAGIGFLFVAVASVMGYSYLLQNLIKTYNGYTMVSAQNFIGIFYFLPLLLVFDLDNLYAVKPNAELVINILFLGIFASAMAFVLFATATKHIGVTRASTFSYLVPIFTALISYYTGHEQFTLTKICGIGVVIIGLFLSQLRFIQIFIKRKSEG